MPAKVDFCRVTGKRLTAEHKRLFGAFTCQAAKKLFARFKDANKARKVMLEDYFYCPLSDGYYKSMRAARCALAQLGFSAVSIAAFYNSESKSHVYCKFPNCGKLVPFELLHLSACTTTHSNQAIKIRRGDLESAHMHFICHLDGMRFKKAFSVGNHLRRVWKYTDAQILEYYEKYERKSAHHSGKCATCGKPANFRGFPRGYDQFCPNGYSCSILWCNKYGGRLEKSGPAIKASHARGNVIPTQVGYWKKKLKCSMKEARAAHAVCMSARRSDAKSIQLRNNCTLEEAEQIRLGITNKWLSSFKRMNWSRVSQDLFWPVYESIKQTFNEVYFATLHEGRRDESKNREFRLRTKKNWALLDFYVPAANCLIEFDGFYWHSAKFTKSASINSDSLTRDDQIKAAIPGLRVMHVQEKKFLKNRDKVIQECVNFIKNIKQ